MLVQLTALLGLTYAGAADRFRAWKADFGKTYGEDTPEHKKRMRIFLKNEREIAGLNAMRKSEMDAKFALNAMSDKTVEEFAAMLGLQTMPKMQKTKNLTRHIGLGMDCDTQGWDVPVCYAQGNGDPIKSIDWVAKGMTTPVKNQGECGSCWAFSTTETVESARLMAGHPKVELSPEQLVDCDVDAEGECCNGCKGGLPLYALQYVGKVGGMESAKVYPYTSLNFENNKQTYACKAKPSEFVSDTKPSRVVFANNPCFRGSCADQDEQSLAQNLYAKGPMSIGVNAGAWQHYQSGIMTADQCGDSDAAALDHAVQLVALTVQSDGSKYWTVRNSWTTEWGVDGFIHLAYGTNTCGVANQPLYVSL